MILTVCLSPCIDVNVEVNNLSVGKINRVYSKRIFYTGKALNVAMGLATLGCECFATGFMYEDNGKLFEQQLHNEGVPYKFVWSKGRVRENYKIIDDKSMMTEINDVSPEVGKEKADELLSLVESLLRNCNGLVVSGSLPNGLSPSVYGELFKLAPKNVKRIVDSEGERLFSALSVGGAALVKPNKEELQRSVNVVINDTHDALTACKKLLDKGAERVLLSLGKAGAIITDGSKAYYGKSVNVAMNSTLGAGDAMVAAASDALLHGEGLKEILRRGVAAGTAAVTSPDSITFKRSKYEEVLDTLKIEEIII